MKDKEHKEGIQCIEMCRRRYQFWKGNPWNTVPGVKRRKEKHHTTRRDQIIYEVCEAVDRRDKRRREMIRALSPPLSKATPIRLLYIDRAFNEPSFTGRATSWVNEVPAFTVVANQRKVVKMKEVRKKGRGQGRKGWRMQNENLKKNENYVKLVHRKRT